jgi:hypothetical protein
MRFIFKIGPIPVNDGVVNAFFVHPPHDDAISFFGGTDREGLEQAVARYGAGELECEPDMAHAGSEFGIRAGNVTPERAHMIGLMTFDIALPHHFDAVEQEGIIYQFGLSCSKFWSASPWCFRFQKQPMRISLAGAVENVFEASVLGGDTEYGLFLYPQPGSIMQAVELAQAGELEKAGRLDSLGVTLPNGPGFAVDGMKRAYGLVRFPVVTRMANGAGVPLGDLDLLSLAAAMSAVSYMTDTNTIGIGRVTVGGMEVQATARAAAAGKEERS